MKRKIPTPSIFPKFHFIPHPNLKLDVFAKSIPPHLDASPQTTPTNTPFPACIIISLGMNDVKFHLARLILADHEGKLFSKSSQDMAQIEFYFSILSTTLMTTE